MKPDDSTPPKPEALEALARFGDVLATAIASSTEGSTDLLSHLLRVHAYVYESERPTVVHPKRWRPSLGGAQEDEILESPNWLEFRRFRRRVADESGGA